MQSETLDDLEAEIEETEAAETEAEQAEHAASVEADPAIAQTLAVLYKAVFDIGFGRAGVAKTTSDEAMALGEATASLIAFYDVQPTTETAMWISFGGAVAAVCVPRLLEYQAIAADKDMKPIMPSTTAAPETGPIDNGGLL